MTPYGELVDIAADDIDAICDYAAKMPADLVVVGPEVPLVLGLVDKLNRTKHSCLWPNSRSRQAGRIQGICQGVLPTP